MPDQLPSSIMDSTISPDSIFALQLDTKQRFDNIEKNIQTPMPIQNLSQSRLYDSKLTNGTIGENLFNEDPKISELASNKLKNNLSNQPVNRGIGVPEHFYWDDSLTKYTNQSAGYDPYSTIEQNEDYYYQQYAQRNPFSKVAITVGKGIGRFADGVFFKSLQTLGYTGGLIWNGLKEIGQGINNMSGGDYDNNAMANIADNSLARWAEHTENSNKNSGLLSVFKPMDWKDKGFFQKMTYGSFWSDEFADGAAFMGEMILTSYALGGLGKLGGLGELGAVEINLANKLGKLGSVAGNTGKLLDFGIKAATGAQDISGIGRWAFLTASESAMEASEGYQTVKSDLISKRNSGVKGYENMTDNEISKIAGNAAAQRFRDNLVILSLSNAFENKFIFEPILGKGVKKLPEEIKRLRRMLGVSEEATLDFGKISRKTYNYKNSVGKFINWKDPNGRLAFYGIRGISSIGAEGLWEENLQLATQRLSINNYYQNESMTGRKADLLKKGFVQIWDAVRGADPEAADSIGLGGLIGLIGTGVTAKLFGGQYRYDSKDENGNEIKGKFSIKGAGERKMYEKMAADEGTRLEKYRRAFFSFNDVYIRDKDGKIIPDENGNAQFDHDKAFEVYKGINNMLSKQEAVALAVNPVYKRTVQHDALKDYIFALKHANMFDKSHKAFMSLSKLDSDAAREMGFQVDTSVDTVSLQRAFEKFGKLYDDIFETNKYKVPLKSADKSLSKEDAIKFDKAQENEQFSRLFVIYTSFAFSHTLHENLLDFNRHLDEQDWSDAVHAKPNPEIIKHNILILRKNSLKQLQGVSDHEFFDAYFANENAQIEKEFSEILPLIDTKTVQFDKSTGFAYTPYNVEDKDMDHTSFLISTQLDSMSRVAEITNDISKEIYIRSLLGHPTKGAENYAILMNWVNVAKERDAETLASQSAYDVSYIPVFEVDPQNEDSNITSYEVIDNRGNSFGKFNTEDEAKAEVEKIKKETEVKETKTETSTETETLTEAQEEIIKKEPEVIDPKVQIVIDNSEEVEYEELITKILDIFKSLGASDNFTREYMLDNLADVANTINNGIRDASGDFEEIDSYNIKRLIELHNKILARDLTGKGTSIEEKIADLKAKRYQLIQEWGTDFDNRERIQDDIDNLTKEINTLSNARDTADSEVGITVSVNDTIYSVKIFHGQEYVGDIKALNDGSNLTIIDSRVILRGQGIGFAAYKLLGKEAAKQGLLLTSDTFNRLSADAIGLWDKLVRTGDAIRGDERYTFQNIPDNKPPVIPPPPPVPPHIVSPDDAFKDEIKKAFEIQERALLNEVSFEEQAKSEGEIIDNNSINDHANDRRNKGEIGLISSNPKELIKEGDKQTLINPSYVANKVKHIFLNKISDGQLDKSDFKIKFSVEKGKLIGFVTDNSGNVSKFTPDGEESNNGTVFIKFYFDEVYSEDKINVSRDEIVKYKTSLPKIPLSLHEIFKIDKNPRTDVLDIIIEFINNNKVLANIDFVTQGPLFRGDVGNDYRRIPKSITHTTAEDAISSGFVFGGLGSIKSKPYIERNIYVHSNRINFRLYRNINNKSQGHEIVEFTPRPIKDILTHDNKNLSEVTMIDINGTKMSIFEAGVKGILPAESIYEVTLRTLLRPDLFIPLNLGNNIMILDVNKFKGLKNTATAEQLKNMTKLEDVMNSEMNIKGIIYEADVNMELMEGILDNSYSAFINKNVLTGANQIEKNGIGIGFTRFNKRIGVTLLNNFGDMLKDKNQRDKATPDTIKDNIPNDTLLGNINTKESEEDLNKEAEDLGNDFKIECE